ncbi:hypothetical protein [Kitasatospora sp. NPDC089509]|uniref:hypothetical protein n=1 Tax=Kitasatospora sp. NPDC089509 TaxID=3364079 RepID=UPI0038086E2F
MPSTSPAGASDRRGPARAGTAVRPGTTPADRPAPRRSRIGLVAQFGLQVLYLPLGVLLPFAVLALILVGGGGAGGDLDLLLAPFEATGAGLSWRRLRIEWRGRPEEWEPFTEELLTKRFARAERKSGWRAADLPPNGERRAVTGLGRHHYRALAPTRVEQLAARHGWSVDWAASRTIDGELRFQRLLPPPVRLGVPDPYGPVPEPGAPWGPLRRRVLVPLLTLVLRPRVRALELLGSPRLYERHLRGHLAKRFRAELARERKRADYRFDRAGRVLRRATVRTPHFRGAGAAVVLRVAAEQGWTLDHSYPADPTGTLHLCRLDGGSPRRR